MSFKKDYRKTMQKIMNISNVKGKYFNRWKKNDI